MFPLNQLSSCCLSAERREGVRSPQPAGRASGPAQPPPALHEPEPEPQRPAALVAARPQVSAPPARLPQPHHGQSLAAAVLLQLLQPLPGRQQDEPQPLPQQPDPAAVQIGVARRWGGAGGAGRGRAGQGGGGREEGGKGKERAGGGAGFNRTNAHGGHPSPRDTVTFTCVGDDHSGAVTLLSENTDDHNNKNNNKRRGSTSKRTGVFHSSAESRTGRVTASISLCSTPPPPPDPNQQRRGNKHIGLSAREVLPKGRSSPIISLFFTGLSRSYVETTRGKIWKKKKKEETFVFVSFALSSPLLVSRVRGPDKHRRSDLYCSVTSALFLSWSCRSDDSFTFF